MKNDNGTQKPILLATSLREKRKSFIETAAAICNKIGRPLKIIHIVEPWVHGETITSFGGMVGGSISDKEISHKLLEGAEIELAGEVETVQVKHGVSFECQLGSPITQIVKASSESFMTILGIGKGYLGPFEILSTVSRVLSQSSVPVMIIPEDFDRSRLDQISFLIADDLEERSQHVSPSGFEFAKYFRAQKIVHCHVTSLTKENLQAGLDMAFAASRFPMTSQPKAGDIFENSCQLLKDKLQTKSEPFRPELESLNCHYDIEIVSGAPTVAIDVVRQKHKPTIEVFGRHHTVHTKPFAFGRMPLSAMTSGMSLVLIVPDQEKSKD